MILDTNALSAAAEGEAGVAVLLSKADQILIPVIVLGEFRFGISQSRNRAQYERWLTEILQTCLVLEISDATTYHYASIRGELKRAGTPIPTNDLWIAALCRQHRAPLLTSDRHFDRIAGLNRIPTD